MCLDIWRITMLSQECRKESNLYIEVYVYYVEMKKMNNTFERSYMDFDSCRTFIILK